MELRQLHDLFAAELIGADLTDPPSAELTQQVEEAMQRYGVLIIRDANITDAQQKTFSRAFGPLELPSRSPSPPQDGSARTFDPDIFHAGNLGPDGKIVPYASEKSALSKGAERFHTDSSFHSMPTKWSLLRGVLVPPPSAGGDTLFSDARAAWDDLPPEKQREIEDLIGLHDFWEGRRLAGLKGEVTPEMFRIVPFPMVKHPLVRSMPGGRKTLFIGGHCIGIEGMDNPAGLALVEELYAHATQDKYIYRHKWQPHDLVIWDNRSTMHAATPLTSDEWPRDMRRTTVNESGPETSARRWMDECGLANPAA